MKKINLLIAALVVLTTASSQTQDRWQQRANYTMEINMDVETHSTRKYDGCSFKKHR